MRFLGGGWGLSAHKVGPSHATRRGWGLLTNRPSSFFSSPFFLFFSPSSSSFLLLSPFIKKQKRVSYRQMPAHSAQAVSHATLVRYCVSCACSYVKKKMGEGRVVRARVWRRDGIVRNERMESCQKKILCGPTGVVTATPLWGESSRLKFLPALMAAVINPCCLEAVEPHNNKGLVTETKQPILKFMKFGHVNVAELRSDGLTRCASDQTFAHIRPPSPHIHISYN